MNHPAPEMVPEAVPETASKTAPKTTSGTPVLRVAVFPPAPPDRLFDYLSPPGHGLVAPGSRVRVPFGRRRQVGVVIESGVPASVAANKLLSVEAVLDEQPVLPPDLLELLHWTARYYQYPIGRVLSQSVPRLVRSGDALSEGRTRVWEVRDGEDEKERLARAPLQQRVFALLRERGPLSEEELSGVLPGWQSPMKALADKGLAAARTLAAPDAACAPSPHRLTEEQEAVLAGLDVGGGFECHLIEGVTGSGKTEIYLRAAERALSAGRQMLVLVPEIGLTSQTVFRFRERCGPVVSTFHSGMGDRARLQTWSRARTGAAKVVIGTRSAVFLPFKSPAIIVVDEEHDVSYKQQESLRYHARDLAIKRAQQLGIPILLGSATPSLESLRNAEKQYRYHRLSRRTGGARMPEVEIIDLRGRKLTGSVSLPLRTEIEERVAREEQVLLFLNRRGYATQVLCHDCGEVVTCPHCDVPFVYHLNVNAMRCHHCGHFAPRPQSCAQCGGADFKDTGMGTERIEQELNSEFPHAEIVRVDADTVRRKGELDKRLEEIRSGGARVLIGTQMLSKGHHFPQVTLVGILNVDQRLFAPDFRALERLGQLVVQVSGRAGRGAAPGKVCLQTYHPDNPHLSCLVHDGYPEFARRLLAEREQARLPPYHFLAVMRASASDAASAADFLNAVRTRLKPGAAGAGADSGVDIFGPSPMVMEKRGGRYRAQLLLSAAGRGVLNRCLREALPAIRRMKGFRQITWHVDVDPVEVE